MSRRMKLRRTQICQLLGSPCIPLLFASNQLTTNYIWCCSFTQLDVDRGFIYYRHRGGEADSDRVEFRISDSSDPQTKSSPAYLEVRITSSENLPPHEMAGTERWIAVSESSGAVLGKKQLWYEDVEEQSDNVVYTVTTQPSFRGDTSTTDAGRLVMMDSGDKPGYSRLSRAEPLFNFTQGDVNEGRVAYVAPRTDIGPSERHASFVFAVTDSHGTAIMDQRFNVTLRPVDDQRPRLRAIAPAVSTAGGRSVRLGTDNLVIDDPDTDYARLIVSVVATPKFGELTKNGRPLRVGDSFPATDFNASDIRSSNIFNGTSPAGKNYQHYCGHLSELCHILT